MGGGGGGTLVCVSVEDMLHPLLQLCFLLALVHLMCEVESTDNP